MKSEWLSFSITCLIGVLVIAAVAPWGQCPATQPTHILFVLNSSDTVALVIEAVRDVKTTPVYGGWKVHYSKDGVKKTVLIPREWHVFTVPIGTKLIGGQNGQGSSQYVVPQRHSPQAQGKSA